jgi:hypothetical protein
VPKNYEFEFEAPPEQLFEETLSAVNVFGFSIIEREDGAFTFNTGPSIWSSSGQDMTATAEPLSQSFSRLVFSAKTAQRGWDTEYGSWGERGRIAKGLAAKVREGLASQ